MANKRLAYIAKVKYDLGTPRYGPPNAHNFDYEIWELLKRVTRDDSVHAGHTVATREITNIADLGEGLYEVTVEGLFMAKVQEWDIFDYDVKVNKIIQEKLIKGRGYSSYGGVGILDILIGPA